MIENFNIKFTAPAWSGNSSVASVITSYIHYSLLVYPPPPPPLQ